VHRARAAALGSPAAEALQVSQVPQHLLDGGLAAECGEVDPRRSLEGGRAVLEEDFLPLVDLTGLDAVLVA